MKKTQLRNSFRKRREGITLEKRTSWSLQICNTLQGTPIYKNAQVIALYVSMGSEVHTKTLIERSLQIGKRVLVPKVVRDHLQFHEIRSMTDLAKGSFGILEPTLHNPVPAEEIELIIVPLLGFDTRCHRIGYGKGYYDRFLQKLQAPTIGFAFEEQRGDCMPESHDVPLSCIITEVSIYGNKECLYSQAT